MTVPLVVRSVVSRSSLLAVLLGAGAAAAEEAASAAEAMANAPEQELRRDTTGFYPLWEGTGNVEQAGAVHIGTTGMQVGIGDVVHVGVQPMMFIERAPNAYAKLAVFASERWRVAVSVGAYRLFAGASGALFSPMYSSRLDNRDFAVTLLPGAPSSPT